ncbi:carbohydrate ABC transporter permease [Gleimia sp. 6138-11-ORH1]|uniref:carbohydrate ABC transporter permease n=1 Tax=Gleimia sp. 6138-11-ORH1 TaxID=2973937 RepID=UPI0021695C46|nr:carbohydrate ABC transporter permease [Gleimia sp. 6138-11-ORH1]MCS4484973.1 carbohydrate ABC transporter permease [Gleimia sp. 6138-11-ORH1]
MTSKLKTLPDGTTYRPSKEGYPVRSVAPSAAARWITAGVLLMVLFYFIFPIYWVVIASSKTNEQLTRTNGLWFDTLNWSTNYETLLAWTNNNFWLYVWNSLLYSTVAGVLGTLMSVAAGYALAKFVFPGKVFTLSLIMSGLLMPAALLTIPLYLIFNNIGITNTVWAIIIPSSISPFGVFLGRVYAQTSVPTELIEAARIDGAGEARIFFTMVLRILAPAMVTIFLFIFVATWNNFLLPQVMLNSEELKPVTLGLYGMMSYFGPERGAVMLGALLGVVPLIVLFLGLQRYWQSGLAAGSVKG